MGQNETGLTAFNTDLQYVLNRSGSLEMNVSDKQTAAKNEHSCCFAEARIS
jgi:hypothetical protein